MVASAGLDKGPRRFDVGAQKYVALTIDDGPDPRFTPGLLDLLREKGARATFFVVGDDVNAHPELVRREVAEGHEIANHTMTHPHAGALTYEQALREIAEGQAAIFAAVGQVPTLFRSPRGEMSLSMGRAVRDSGLVSMHWRVGLENKDAKTPQAMAHRVMDKISPGSIILMHDGRLNRTRSVEALGLLLDLLDAQGYHVVTASELMQRAGIRVSDVRE